MNKFLKKLLPVYQKMGVNLISNHYEEPIPELSELKKFNWEKESELSGIDLRISRQIRLLKDISKRHLTEFKKLPWTRTSRSVGEDYFHLNPSFKGVDAGIYYGLIRRLRPRRIIEVGAGFSTFLAAKAVLLNRSEKYPCELTAIEPYPSKALRSGVPGVTHVLETEIQKVPLDEFKKLGKNDILFIDSSHVSKIGSDVQYEFSEILPGLGKGVYVHFHDIFLPQDYPRKLITQDFKFYNEQYLLQAFLSFNRAFEVVWAGQCMYRKHHSSIQEHFGEFFKDDNPERYWRSVSFWVRRK